jgi:Domain of unknown function (DUF5659)
MEFRTNDMGLATYLKMCGCPLLKAEWQDLTCHWFFEQTDDLVESVTAWETERAQVNPKQFTRQYAKTKKEFYESRGTAPA